MRQYLDGGLGDIAVAGHAKLSADTVCAGCSTVSSECSVGIISAMLGYVLNEGDCVQAGPGKSQVEDTLARREGDWNAHVHAYFGRGRAGVPG